MYLSSQQLNEVRKNCHSLESEQKGCSALGLQKDCDKLSTTLASALTHRLMLLPICTPFVC